MKNKLDCDIVRDLMPSFADKIASEKTQEAVREHIADCPKCEKVLLDMLEGEGATAHGETAEIDYLKKLKRKQRAGKLVSFATAFVIAVSCFLVNMFLIGEVDYDKETVKSLTVSDKRIEYTLDCENENRRITRVKISEADGVITVKAYTAPRLFGSKSVYHGEYTSSSNIDEVSFANEKIWQGGYYTDSLEYKLFKLATPFCGDIVKNLEIAEAVGIYDNIGNFTSELYTSKQPFGWGIFLKNKIPTDDETHYVRLMKTESCAILAVIGNLDYITWSYTVGDQSRKLTVTADDASAMVGGDIKSFSDSVSSVKKLVDKIQIK